MGRQGLDYRRLQSDGRWAGKQSPGPKRTFDRRLTMTSRTSSVRKENQNQVIKRTELLSASTGLALVRLTIGAMFVSVFFENLGKGTYTTGGYAGVINYYIKSSHSPAVWKAVMQLMASNAAIAAPLQALTEISLGVLLVIGLFTRPAAFVAFLFLGSLWISELGTSWIWELLVSVLGSLALSEGTPARRGGGMPPLRSGGRPP